MSNLQFPAKFFSAKLQLKKFWAWAETKTGFCLGREQQNYLTNFKHFGSSTCSYVQIQSPIFMLAIGIMGLIMIMWTCWRSLFEICQIGKELNIVKIFETPCYTNKEVLQVIKHKMQHLYQINRSNNSSAQVISKNLLFHKKWTKRALNVRVCLFLLFFHFNNVFVTPCYIQAIFNFWDPILSELSHSQSPYHFYNLETNTETHFIVWQSFFSSSLNNLKGSFAVLT